MANEKILNDYYNIGHFNHPKLIGYMMKMIRELKPLTVSEWKQWYLDNKHDAEYIDNIAVQMHASIPESLGVTLEECNKYVYDVMFRRTFDGYNKEKKALKYLKQTVSEAVEESSEEWDTKYFIDFFIPASNAHPMIGIQLKPDSFYHGHYQSVVDIEGKMKAFRDTYGAITFVLTYKKSGDDSIVFSDMSMIEQIKNILN